MSVSPGDRLGRYEVLSLLGRGGMGEVYKARDSRLDRLVAIKVLFGAASQPDRLIRFEREARAISALDHPNICAIYDVGEAGGVHFIVIQYLEGQTLAERLRRGPLPISQVVRYGVEIADALDRAHRVGIIHRDLKPANVMLTGSGAKLLDFGLAKQQDDTPMGLSSLTRLGDLDVTADGTVLGTYPYMAPEQVEGRRADARTDIFAFGAVMYEAATGSRAFPGPTAASVIGSVLKDDPPPLTTQLPLAPAALEQLVQTCLEKNPDDRWQSAADIKRQLAWIASSRASSDVAAQVSPPSTRRFQKWALAAVLVAAIALTLPAALRPAPAAPVWKFPVDPPPNATFAAPIAQVPSTQFALSPDGRVLAFVATRPGEPPRLWLREMDKLNPVPLEGTEGASFPFWSHDGRAIAFFSRSQLKRVDRTGGPPRDICDVGVDPRGGAWNQDNVIIYAPGTSSGLWKVNAGDGTPPESLLELSKGDNSYRWPTFLPDGRRFLFHVKAGKAKTIRLGSLGSASTTLVLANAPYAALYSPPGYVLTVRDGTLHAYPFDESALPIGGEGINVAVGVGGSTSLRASFSVSPAGLLAYAGPLLTQSRLEWFDRKGGSLGTATDHVGDYVNLRLSPDGTRAAVTMVDRKNNTTDLWILDLASRLLEPFTTHPDTDTSPVWSQDGRRIRFRSDRAGGLFPFEKPADRSEVEHQVASIDTVFLTDWSADDKVMAFHSSTDTGSYDAGVVAEGSTPQFLDRSPFTELGGRFSRDRRWIAYSSDVSGQMEVYVGPYPAGPGKLVSNGGGSEPHWRADSGELFYLAADRSLVSVMVGDGPSWNPMPPRRLFSTGVIFASDIYRMNYDIHRSGQKFLVIKPVEGVQSGPITVVVNWASMLQR